MKQFQTIGEIIRIRHYSITKNLDYQETDDIAPTGADEPLYWVKQYCGKQRSAPHWIRYEYDIYDNDGNPVKEVTEDGWRMFEFGENAGFVNFSGADPSGRIIQKGMDFGIKGIVKSLLFLKELSRYSSWEGFKLIDENQVLLSKLESLQNEKEMLLSNLS